ncbi:hypothetical protein HDV00_011134 [Rhizophlyctis rosea]|nr:hypothetical protein HDV00_011134 [Rhizophlyctis rosea]
MDRQGPYSQPPPQMQQQQHHRMPDHYQQQQQQHMQDHYQQQQYRQQQQQQQQQQMAGKMSTEEFDRQLQQRSGPTRLTLSEQRRFSGDSADGMDMRALSSKDAFFDYVSSATPDAFGPASGNMQGPQPVHRQQQRLADEAMSGRASPYMQGRGSPAPGSPYQMGYGNNGGMAGAPNGSQQGYFPPNGQRPGMPMRQGSVDPYMEDDRNARSTPPTQTQQLAEFFRNTGPDQPFSSQQQQPQYEQQSRQQSEQKQPEAAPPKQKKRATGIFKGFGKKKNKDIEISVQGGQGGPQGSADKPKYVKLNVAYDPFKEGGGQDVVEDDSQMSNREIRRSIIIAQDEGWFGAPLQHTQTGRQRRPESLIYEQTVAQARASAYVPGQGQPPFIPPPQQQQHQQQMQYGAPEHQQQREPQPRHVQQMQQHPQQQYHQQDGPHGGDGPQHHQQLRELPPEAIPPRHSFPYASQQMRDAYLGGEEYQNMGPGGREAPGDSAPHGPRTDSRQPPAQAPPMSSNAAPPPQQPDYLDDNEDWDDEEYDDEDTFSEMDEEVLRNTEMNAMIDLGLGDVMDPPRKMSNRPKRNVVFNQTVEELAGAWEYSDGELEYGPLEVSTGSLRMEDDGHHDAPVAHRVSIAMSDGGDGPVIKSRGSSLIYATNKNGAPIPLPFGPPPSQQQSGNMQPPPPMVAPSPMPSEQGPPVRRRDPPPIPVQNDHVREYTTAPPPTEPVQPAPMDQRAPSSDESPAPSPVPPPVSTTASGPDHDTTSANRASVVSSSGQQTGSSAPRTRKKVRHVQIQTKGVATRDGDCQTSAHLLPTAPTPLPITDPSSDSAMEEALRAAEAEATQLRTQTAHMHAENAALLSELASLRDGLAVAQEEREKLQWAMEDNKGKFDRLSAQAYKKIKELLVERQVMEIEIASLRGQLDSLEVQQRAWMEMEEEGYGEETYGQGMPNGVPQGVAQGMSHS